MARSAVRGWNMTAPCPWPDRGSAASVPVRCDSSPTSCSVAHIAPVAAGWVGGWVWTDQRDAQEGVPASDATHRRGHRRHHGRPFAAVPTGVSPRSAIMARRPSAGLATPRPIPSGEVNDPRPKEVTRWQASLADQTARTGHGSGTRPARSTPAPGGRKPPPNKKNPPEGKPPPKPSGPAPPRVRGGAGKGPPPPLQAEDRRPALAR